MRFFILSTVTQNIILFTETISKYVTTEQLDANTWTSKLTASIASSFKLLFKWFYEPQLCGSNSFYRKEWKSFTLQAFMTVQQIHSIYSRNIGWQCKLLQFSHKECRFFGKKKAFVACNNLLQIISLRFYTCFSKYIFRLDFNPQMTI